MDPRHRADVLRYLDPRADSGRAVRRVERWRRRGLGWGEIARRAEGLAARLAGLGVQAGDRVGLVVRDGPLWIVAFFGALRAGGVAVPLDPGLDAGELAALGGGLDLAAWCLDAEGPRLELAPAVEVGWREQGPGAAGPAPPWPTDDPARIAQIVLTSGTTGAPGGVAVSHANLLAVLDALAGEIGRHRWALRVAPRLGIGAALPLSHLYGQLMGVFVPWHLGARASLVETMPAPELARALREERVWVLATVPRTLALLGDWLAERGRERWGAAGFERRVARALELPWWRRRGPLRAVRGELGVRLVAVVSGGGALDPAVERVWRALGLVVVQGYGLTETAPLVTLGDPFDARPGSLGRPLPGVELQVAGDGEILVRGPNVAAAARVDAEGWLHTGDVGRLDADGRLRFLGRKGERIVTPAGVNVDPGPIEARLEAQPAVAGAVVVERPWGARGALCAVVLPQPGGAVETAVRAVNAALPDAARIRAWRAWPEVDFPRTRTGKPRRAAIAAWLAGRPAEEAEGCADPQAYAAEGESEAARGAFGVLAREAATVAGLEPDRLTPGTRLDDVLGSLERVELATRLETRAGLVPVETLFTGAATLGELAGGLSAGGAADTKSAPRSAPDAIPLHAARFRAPVGVAREILREGALRPAWRSLLRRDVAGLENLAAVEPPVLFAANHVSVLDPGAVLFALPWRLRRRLAPTAMWEHFARGRARRAEYLAAAWGLDLIPLVQRGDWRPTLRIAGAVADRGGCPLVFPEGERSADGTLLAFRPGIAVMARDLHLPVVPCAIVGLSAVLPRDARWPRGTWRGRAPLAVRFGAPLPAPRPGEDVDAFVAELKRRVATLRTDAETALP